MDGTSQIGRGVSIRGEVSDDFIESTILGDQMWSGHLKEFCESQFNAENLDFFLAVIRFRELMLVDKSCWKTPWQDIDISLLTCDVNETSWPSKIVNRNEVVEIMQQIKIKYLDDDGEDSICMSLAMYERTLRRIGRLDLYGPYVFSEACIDPVKTLRQDIIPRFKASKFYLEMKEKLSAGKTVYEKKAVINEDDEENQDKMVVVTESAPKPQDNIFLLLLTSVFVTFPRVLFLSTLSYFTRKAVADPNSKLLRSLLSKQWSYAVPGTIALNIFLNIILGVEHYFSSEPVCNYKHEFAYWVWLIDYTICCGFAVSIFLNVSRMANSTGQLSNELYAALAGNIGISIMAGGAMILTTSINYGGTCIDMFGVVTPSTQWPEWLTTVPFLIYTAVAVEDKERLNTADILVIISMFFCILTGYFLNLELPWWLAYLLLIISCVSMLSTVYMVVRANKNHAEVSGQEHSALTRAAYIAEAEQARNLSVLCLVAMPILPILYFMAIGNLLSVDVFYSSNNIMSCMVKLVFAAIAAEGHMSTTEQMFTALQTDVELAKEGEAFAEHLFHKVTIPLKSVTAGMDLLSEIMESKGAKEAAQVRALRDTTEYISQNLADLMSADRSQIKKEDALRLISMPFVLSDLLKKVLVSFQKQMRKKLLNCKMDISPDVPKMMVGDMTRLNHVLSALFNKGLTASKSRGVMTLRITSRGFLGNSESSDNEPLGRVRGGAGAGSRNASRANSRNGGTRRASDDIVRSFSTEEDDKGNGNKKALHLLVFEVTRAVSITPEEEAIYINPMRKGKDGKEDPEAKALAAANRDLVQAREIVVLHGGSVVYSSSPKSTTLGFSIPYEIVHGM
eukprot:gene36155-47005_t